MNNIVIEIEKLDVTNNSNELFKQEEPIEAEYIINYRKEYWEKVRIIASDDELDEEDLLRKYSRDYTFWVIQEKYLKQETNDPDFVEKLNYIRKRKKESAQRITEKFNEDIIKKIYQRVDIYLNKDDKYGNTGKTRQPLYTNDKDNQIEYNPNYTNYHRKLRSKIGLTTPELNLDKPI